MHAIDAGAEDVLHEEGYYEVQTDVEHFNAVKQQLCLQGSNLSVWILRFCRRHPPLFRMKKPDQYGKTD